MSLCKLRNDETTLSISTSGVLTIDNTQDFSEWLSESLIKLTASHIFLQVVSMLETLISSECHETIRLNSSDAPIFRLLKKRKTISNISNTEKVVMMVKPAPKPKPRAIARKRYTSSSGSLIGVRKRTIDSAPTSPNESAREDFTTTITKKTINDSKGRIVPIWFLPVREVEYLT